MIRSMTGFATHSFETTLNGFPCAVTIQIKSVNGRFFDGSCRLPHLLSPLETRILRELKTRLLRGSVYCSISMNVDSSAQTAISPSISTARAYHQALNRIRTELQLSDEITLRDLLGLPNLFVQQEQTLDPVLEDALFKELPRAIDKLVTVQETEGAALEKDLRGALARMSAARTAIKERAAAAMERKRTELMRNLENIVGASKEAREHYLYLVQTHLDKMDINEELVRLATHLDALNSLFDSADGEKGKRFEFTLQEALRESNTIASKSSDSDISAHVVSLKVDIEKAREQINNIV